MKKELHFNHFISFILSILIGITVIVFTGYKCSKLDYSKTTMPDMFILQEQIKTMQNLLNEYEPENPIKVDGLLGQKTYDKWERWYCNESARIIIEGE